MSSLLPTSAGPPKHQHRASAFTDRASTAAPHGLDTQPVDAQPVARSGEPGLPEVEPEDLMTEVDVAVLAGWPALARFVRCVVATGSMTDLLTRWTNRPAHVQVLRLREDVRVPDKLRKEFALPGHAQQRWVHLSFGGQLVMTGESFVAADAVVLTEQVRAALTLGRGSLGTILGQQGFERVLLDVAPLTIRLSGDPTTPVVRFRTRLDVGGVPVAACIETVHESALTAFTGLGENPTAATPTSFGLRDTGTTAGTTAGTEVDVVGRPEGRRSA